MSALRIILLAALLALTTAACSDDTTYKDCWTYTRSDGQGGFFTVKECCRTECEQEWDGDVDCDTDCSCEIEDTDIEVACDPYYYP